MQLYTYWLGGTAPGVVLQLLAGPAYAVSIGGPWLGLCWKAHRFLIPFCVLTDPFKSLALAAVPDSLPAAAPDPHWDMRRHNQKFFLVLVV